MSDEAPPDRRVTLLDAMIGLTEFAVLMGLVTSATRDVVAAGGGASIAVAVCFAVLATLPLAGAWWVGVRFANESGRRRFRERLAAHLLSLTATVGLMFVTLLSCGLPAILALAWWAVRPTDEVDEGRSAGAAE